MDKLKHKILTTWFASSFIMLIYINLFIGFEIPNFVEKMAWKHFYLPIAIHSGFFLYLLFKEKIDDLEQRMNNWWHYGPYN